MQIVEYNPKFICPGDLYTRKILWAEFDRPALDIVTGFKSIQDATAVGYKRWGCSSGTIKLHTPLMYLQSFFCNRDGFSFIVFNWVIETDIVFSSFSYSPFVRSINLINDLCVKKEFDKAFTALCRTRL